MDLVNKDYSVQHFFVEDDGIFPNNSSMPVIHYEQVLNVPRLFPANRVIGLFKKNNWYNAWKDSIYNFHHYHSHTHEVLGIYKGSTRLQIGGAQGRELTIRKGDVLIIPAGVAHKNLAPGGFFGCVGAYPDGRSVDFKYGLLGERPMADVNILLVPYPLYDPVFSGGGELQRFKDHQ